jgi:hypothetical protein
MRSVTRTENHLLFLCVFLEMILRITGEECTTWERYCTSYWTSRNCVCCKGEEKLERQVRVATDYTETQYMCSACPAGTFKTDDWHISLCDTCPQGTYHWQADTGKTSCSVCALGKYGAAVFPRVLNAGQSNIDSLCPLYEARKSSGMDANTPRTSCSGCSAGSVSSAGSATCSDCNSGKYQDGTGKSECKTCDAGTYTPTNQNSKWNSCKKCEKGKSQSSAGQTGCNPCATGKYMATEGVNTECTLCEKGKFVDTTEATVCLGCHQDRYQPDTGKSKCETCAAGKYSVAGTSITAPGATSCSECVAGKYMSPIIPRRVPCLDCSYSCPTGKVLAGCLPTTKFEGKCMNCGIGKFLNVSSAECQSCPVATFQKKEKHTQFNCQKCPLGSSSPEGSISVDMCKCYVMMILLFCEKN